MNKILRMHSSNRFISFLLPAAAAMVFALLFATAPSHSAHAVTAQEAPQCTNIRDFGALVVKNAKADIVTMKASFVVTYQAMLDAWKKEDAMNDAGWQVLVNGFDSGVKEQVAAATPARKALLETYRTTVMDSLNQYKVLADAARAQYREDMAALVRQHQAALEKLAANYVTTLTTKTTAALTNCDASGADLSFLFNILGTGFQYIGDVLSQDFTYVAKALNIIATYVSAIVNGVSTLINSVISSIVTVLVGMLKTP